jgi:fructose-1,6-bisphosphatase I
MTADLVLESYLDQTAATGDLPAAAARAVAAIAAAGRTIAELLAAGPLAGALAASVGSPANDWGDAQKALDIRAHDMMLAALHAAGVASVLSEEAEQPVAVDAAGRVAVAIDPLDGSSNIDTNVPVGTIFSILPAAAGFLVPGHMQIAAGFMIYGVNTGLAVTFGDGTRLFTLDRSRGVFRSTGRPIAIPPQTAEFAINSSNRRHWDIAIRAYIDGCLAGEAYRILIRGGIYLYPADDRTGYRHGRLRLIYEANPVAMLAEQAGGASTDGRTRILDLVPHSVHQRTPLVFGSRDEVAEIAACYHRPASDYTSPLFSPRSLFRA